MSGVTRHAVSASPLPDALDEKILAWLPPPTADVPVGFLDMTMSSHVLLSACRHNEVALENTSMEKRGPWRLYPVPGLFTRQGKGSDPNHIFRID
jgi:hypothetical protein